MNREQMKPERWRQVEELYHSALEREVSQRAAFIARACRDDEALRRKVESLLSCEVRAEHFIETPALEAAAELYAGGQVTEAPDTSSPTLICSSPLESGELSETPIFIGDYRLIRQLGEGGMGIVYEAEQQQPRRPVAVKVIRGGRLVGEYQVKLFQREMQALARLKHPGIAAIYESGRTEDGQHYFAMELVCGIPLQDYIKGRRLTGTQVPCGIRQRLMLFLKICEAISYAHQRGVIHRDLKPANILVVDESEGQSLDGSTMSRVEVKVLDFGLARIISDNESGASFLTGAGEIRGTLPYMSPEQVRGDPGEIDVRTDVYALGVILYELLAEQLPYEFGRVALPQAFRVICEEKPKPLSQVIDRDVETIVLAALEKDPERRYQSVTAMAEDVARFLTDRPIKARPPSALYLLRKLLTRHKALFAFLATVTVLLLMFLMVTLAQTIRIARERDKAGRQLYAAHMNLAIQAWEAAHIGRVQELLESHLPKPSGEDMRGFEWYYLWRLSHPSLLTLKGAGHKGFISSVAFSPDGERLATGSWDNTARLWDTATGRELVTLEGHTDRVFSIAFSPDGKRLATGSGDRTVKLWDTATGKELITLKGHGDAIHSVAFSPDGKKLATGSGDGTTKLWDGATGKEIITFKGIATSVAFSPDGERLATVEVNRVTLWDVARGHKLLHLLAHDESYVTSIAFSPDGKRLATGSGDRTVKLWDTATGKELITRHRAESAPGFLLAYSVRMGNEEITLYGSRVNELMTLYGHKDSISSVAFSPDGERLATGSWDNTARLWDTATGRELVTLEGHTDRVFSIAFSPDGKRLATGSWDRTVKLWDLVAREESVTLKGHRGAISSVAFSADGERLVTGSNDHTVRLWDAVTARELVNTIGHDTPITLAAMSPDGKRLAMRGGDRTVKLWDMQSRKELATLKGHTGEVSSVTFSSDGRTLASGSDDRTVKLWDMATGKEIITLKWHVGAVHSVAFSPDGKRLATGSRDIVARLWDTTTGQQLFALRGHQGQINSVAFSPDGKRLATGSSDRTARLWDVPTGQELTTLKGHGEAIHSVAFSPDGKRLATGSGDRTVKLWAVSTGQELITLKGHGEAIHSVAFSPDGKRLATGSGDRTVRLWSAATENEVLARSKQ